MRKIKNGKIIILSIGLLIMITSTKIKENHIIIDIDGNKYSTVQIGNQTWMAENLRTTSYNDGSEIMTSLTNEEWANIASGAYSIYDNTQENADDIILGKEIVESYGLLYNWYAVEDSRGICPDGWSIPTKEDWELLINYLIEDHGLKNEWDVFEGVGNALKSCYSIESQLDIKCLTDKHPRWGLSGWPDERPKKRYYGTDKFGFAALPGGNRDTKGNYNLLGGRGWWWTSTTKEKEKSSAKAYMLCSGMKHIALVNQNLTMGLSVRCIKN